MAVRIGGNPAKKRLLPALPIVDAPAGTTVSVPVASHAYTASAPQVRSRIQPGAASHSYTAQTPQTRGKVQPAPASHNYSAIAPQLRAKVQPGAASHTYAGIAPKASSTIRPAAVQHVYAGIAPKANSKVQPAVVGHTYTAQVPTVLAGADTVVSAGVVSHSYAAHVPQLRSRVQPSTVSHRYRLVGSTQSASDAFNRSDEVPLASPWVTCLSDGGVNLNSNFVTGTSGTFRGSYYGGISWEDDQSSQGVVGNLVGAEATRPGVLVRADSSGNAFAAYVSGASSNNTIVRWDSGVSTELGSFSSVFANGDVLKLAVSGISPNISLEVLKNGVQVALLTGVSGHDSGAPGITCRGGGTLDDWSAQAIIEVPPQIRQRVQAGAATHVYSAVAPKANSQISPGPAQHTYAAISPQARARVAPGAATHTYTAQAPKASVRVQAGAATHVYAGQAPGLNSGNAVLPGAATHTYSSMEPQVRSKLQPSAAQHAYTGQPPSAKTSIRTVYAQHAYAAQAPQLRQSVKPGAAMHVYAGQAPAPTNAVIVAPGAAQHAYSTPTPALRTRVQPGPVTHIYVAVAPVNVQAAPIIDPAIGSGGAAARQHRGWSPRIRDDEAEALELERALNARRNRQPETPKRDPATEPAAAPAIPHAIPPVAPIKAFDSRENSGVSSVPELGTLADIARSNIEPAPPAVELAPESGPGPVEAAQHADPAIIVEPTLPEPVKASRPRRKLPAEVMKIALIYLLSDDD